MIRHALSLAVPLALSLSAAASAQAPEAVAPAADGPQWGTLLEADARAMHAAIKESHPGPVDDLNPGFRKTLEDGFRLVLERARTTRSLGGWWWALREYEAAFDDGHLALNALEKMPDLPTRWPGFLTRFEGEAQVVAVREDGPGLPALGARLESCDGRPAARLAAENVGRFRGRWELASQRARHGARLFLDASNPWIRLPARCVFTEGGKRKTYALAWRPLEGDAIGQRLGAAAASFRAPIERRTLTDGTIWISAGSFNGDLASDQAKALRALIEGMKAEAAALRTAPAVVLDLRGNGGGSSMWGAEMAAALWGQAFLDTRALPPTQVDWRVSDANLAMLETYAKMFREDPKTDPQVLRWIESAVAGMREARARGQSLWRQPDEPAAGPPPPAEPLYHGRVYVLTDAACASACLDTVDVWKAAGAVQVGRETSADTLYMDIREQPLPSGMAQLNLPMKVYRGRARGLNQPHRPARLFEGDMTDTRALEAWILSLR